MIVFRGVEMLRTLNTRTKHYCAAVFVAFIWSTTFVSTKVLLEELSPLEILIYRYALAYLCFVALDPKFEKPQGLRAELTFAAAGLLGVTLYFLAENYAVHLSVPSNVALLVVLSPLFTGLLAHFMTKGEPLTKSFMVGCIVAMSGVFLVVFNGHFILKLNPLGDLLAISASILFAFYSILLKNLDKAYSALFITRRSFFYALISMLPLTFLPSFRWFPPALLKPEALLNLAFLAVLASCLCFLVWNKVIWGLGVVKANNILYLVPPMTMAASALLLGELVTSFALSGAALVLAGVYISQR